MLRVQVYKNQEVTQEKAVLIQVQRLRVSSYGRHRGTLDEEMVTSAHSERSRAKSAPLVISLFPIRVSSGWYGKRDTVRDNVCIAVFNGILNVHREEGCNALENAKSGVVRPT